MADPKKIPTFTWPKCPQCKREVNVGGSMGGDKVARCSYCDGRDGYATAKTSLAALRKYARGDVCD